MKDGGRGREIWNYLCIVERRRKSEVSTLTAGEPKSKETVFLAG